MCLTVKYNESTKEFIAYEGSKRITARKRIDTLKAALINIHLYDEIEVCSIVSPQSKTLNTFNDVRQDVLNMVKKAVENARVLWPSITLNDPEVIFYQKGRAAGKANSYFNYVKFNEILAKENLNKFDEVVKHEVAHLVVPKLYGKEASAHGPEFKRVLIAMGGSGDRCHSFDVSNTKVKKTVKRYIYKCGCRSHNVTTSTHKKIDGGAKFTCRSCKGVVTFTGNYITITK